MMQYPLKKGKKMRVKPIGFSVLVKPDDVDEYSDAGVFLGSNKKEEAVVVEGTVLAVAEGAWSDKPEGSYPKVGDRVVFAKYAGAEVTIDREKGTKAKLMVDEEIKAIIVEDN